MVLSSRSPATMTPQTIARIRGASSVYSAAEIAHSLNWDEARVRRVAKAHNIDLLFGATTGVTSHPMLSCHESKKPPQGRHDLSKSKFTWAALSLDEIAERLSPRQRQIILHLKANVDGELVSMAALARRINPQFTSANVDSAIKMITMKLIDKQARWRTDWRRGRNGGYRLRSVEGDST